MLRYCVLFCIFMVFCIGCSKPIKEISYLQNDIPDKIENSVVLEDIDGEDTVNSGDPLQNLYYMFEDNDLHNIMTLALKNNPDILILASKIRQARSEVLIAGGELLPTVSVGGDYSYSDGNYSSSNASSNNSFKVSASFSWEIDLFGRISSEQKASQKYYESAEKDFLLGKVVLLSDVAGYYFSMRSAAARLKVYEKILKNYDELLAVYKQQLEFGFVEASDVMSAENDFLSAYNSMKKLEVELEQSKNALLALIGVKELGFDVFSEYAMPTPRLPNISNLPIETIFNRPDVMMSLDNYEAALFKTESRRANLYPSLKVSGSIGQVIASSNGVGDLLWQITGSISAPLLNRKELYEGLHIQQEAEKQAEYTVYKTISTALAEIEDSVFQAGVSKNILLNSQLVYKNASETMRYIEGKYNYGLADIIEILKSKNEELNTKASLDTAEYNNIVSNINLYKAFGGAFGRPLNMVEYGSDY